MTSCELELRELELEVMSMARELNPQNDALAQMVRPPRGGCAWCRQEAGAAWLESNPSSTICPTHAAWEQRRLWLSHVDPALIAWCLEVFARWGS